MSRILLVEDDTMIASGILYALETEGYETNHATGIKGNYRYAASGWNWI